MMQTLIAGLKKNCRSSAVRALGRAAAVVVLLAAGRAAAQPANDVFANAFVLTGTSGSTNGDSTLATLEAPCETNLVNCDDDGLHNVTNSVWFVWTAPATGTVQFDTIGSSFDTVLSVWTDTNGVPTLCDGSITNIISDDSSGAPTDPGFFDTSLVTLNVTAGQTYYLAVESYDDGTFDGSYLGGNFGPYILNWNMTAIPTINSGNFALSSTSYTYSEHETDRGVYPDIFGARVTVTRPSPGYGRVLVDYTLTNPPGFDVFSVTYGNVITTNDNLFYNGQSYNLGSSVNTNTAGNVFTSATVTNIINVATNVGGTAFLPPVTNTYYYVVSYATNNVQTTTNFDSFVDASSTFTTNFQVLPAQVTALVSSNSVVVNAGIAPASGTLAFDNLNLNQDIVFPVVAGLGYTSGFRQVVIDEGVSTVVLSNPRLDDREDSITLLPPGLGANFTAQVKIESTRVRNIFSSNAVINFVRSTYAVTNKPGTATLTLMRSGDTASGAAVDWVIDGVPTQNGYNPVNTFPLQAGSDYAQPGIDYSNVSGTVSWGSNDGNDKDIQIPVLDPGQVEFNMDFSVTIYNPSPSPYVRVGNVSRSTVTILYNEQPAGAADRTWNQDNSANSTPEFQPYTGTAGNGGTVYAIAEQPDGSAIVAGSFSSYDEGKYNGIVRVLSNGYQDPTFQGNFSPWWNTGANDFISALALQPDGKIIIAGNFTAYNGNNRRHIARLNSDGSLDNTFTPGVGADAIIWALSLQPSGQIMIAGAFTNYNGTMVRGVARLNSDGSLDSTFNPGVGPDGTVNAVAVDAAGRVIIAGAFENVDGVANGAVARLNSDGSLDTTFTPGIGTFNPESGDTDAIHALAVQADGKILIGGSFAYFNLVSYNGLARLATDGTLDLSFSPGSGTLNPITGDADTIYNIQLQTNGEIMVGGNLTAFNQTRRYGLALLFADGSVDTSFMDSAYNAYAGLSNPYFNPAAVATNFPYLNPLNYNTRNYVFAIAPDVTGNVLIGGSFARVGGGYNREDVRYRNNVTRLIGGATPGPGNMQFYASQYQFNNNSGSNYVSLIRTNGNLGSVSVTFSTNTAAPGPGIASGADFGLDPVYSNPTWTTAWSSQWQYEYGVYGRNAATTPVNTHGGAVNADVWITTTNSGNITGDLNANFALSNPTGAFKLGGQYIQLDAALGAQSAVPLTIHDVNSKPGVFGFSSPVYSVVENGSSATITITRTNGADGSATIWYAVSGGTATNGVDFTGTTNSHTFNAGDTSWSFTVATKSKYTSIQPDKTVNLRLFGATGGATIGLTNAVLTLINPNGNANGHLAFASASFATNENSGTLYVTVNRLGSSSGLMGVTVVSANGSGPNTAYAGTNYTSISTTLSWPSGNATPQTVAIPVLHDFVVTPDLTAWIYLTNSTVSGTNNVTPLTFGTPGSSTNATLTIQNVDSAGQLQFSTANYSVNKNGGFALNPVVRTGGSIGSITNYYSTLDGIGASGAVSNVDYYATTNTLVFTNGQVSQYFTVPIIDNYYTNPAVKSLSLQLFGANLGTPNSAKLNIVNSDWVTEETGGGSDVTFSTNGFNNTVYALSLQSNNKILAGGDFTLAEGVTRERIARLNVDGTLDTGFSLPSSAWGANASVRAIAVQTDGRILIGGLFTNINGTTMNRVARLNSDGGRDNAFNPGAGADNGVYAIAQSLAGKVLIGGGFATVAGFTFHGVAQLNNDGTPDNTFNAAGIGANATVYALAVQPDGRIVIGGDFTSYNGVTNFNHIARLNADGSVDASFTPGAGVNGSVRAISVQLDGKILIGGIFTNVNGFARNRVARLNSDGTVDTSFTPGVGANDVVYAIAVQSNGRIVLGGSFTTASGVTRNRITRLNPDGTVDPTINFGTGANDFVAALLVQQDTIAGLATNVPDEKIILAGNFTQYNSAPHGRIARIFGGSTSGSGQFTFAASDYYVDERGTNVVISVLRTGGTTNAPSGDVFVTAGIIDGSAVGGVNFTNNSPYVLDFPLGEVIKTITIPVIPDGVVTTNLTLVLQITNVTAPASASGQPITTLHIINDDATIAFSSATYLVPKNIVSGVAPITVSRSGSTAGSATVSFTTYAVTNSPATIGIDYVPVSQTATFAPGVSNVTVNIPIVNNGIPEGNRNIGLAIFAPTNAALATPTNALLTIIDTVNAPGQLSYSATNYNVTEGGGVGYTTAYVSVQRTLGSYGAVSVNFTTLDGTAVSGLKYVPTNGVLNFADGESSKSFAVQVVNTATAEGPQYFNVLLSGPTGGAALATPTNATVTILNTNTGLAFASGTNTFTEPSGVLPGTVLVNVVRFNNTNGTTTVHYSTTNGTAVTGTNYVGLTNGLLTFNPGESVKSIVVTTLHDTRVTGDLTFGISLFNPSLDAQLTAPSTTLMVDRDADVGVYFPSSSQFTYRNSGGVIIPVAITSTNLGQISVNYATGGGDAVPGLDYSTTSGTLTFTNGQSVNYIIVPVLVNNQVLTNRMFNVTLSAPTAPGQLIYPYVETNTIIGTNTPPGLSFATPLVINGGWGSTNVDNSASVPELGDPNIAGQTPVAPVWIAWTAPYDGEVTVDTIGSKGTNGVKLDTVLGVFTGNSLSTLNQVAANDDLFPVNYTFQSGLTTSGSLVGQQYNETFQNIYSTNLLVVTNIYNYSFFIPGYGLFNFGYTNIFTNPPTFTDVPTIQYYSPFYGPSGVRFNAKAGTTYYFAADTKSSFNSYYSPYPYSTIVNSAAGPIQFNWAYHSSGVFRFATEDVEQTGIVDTNGNPMLLYHCAETEGIGTGGIGIIGGGNFRSGNLHGVRNPANSALEQRTTQNSYYDPDVEGLLVTVTRVSGSSGRVLVDYTTMDGDTNLIKQGDSVAVAGVDYTPRAGTLIFDDYEMSKTIYVPILDDGGASQPNRDFMVLLSNPRRDPAESTNVSPPRVDNIFGKVVCRILDCDIDPNGWSTISQVVTNSVVIGGVPTNVVSTNLVTTLIPTNGVFNFSKANYRVPRDIANFFPNTPVTVYVNRMGTNRSSVTVHYRFDNRALANNSADNVNIYFPLQPGSDYAVPTPATSSGILGVNSDFNGSDGTLTFPGGNNNPFQSQPIHFTVANNYLSSFNKDIRIGIYELDKNNVPFQDGMVAETTVTILTDDLAPPAGAVDEFYNPDFGSDMVDWNTNNIVGTSVLNPGTDPYSEVYALAVTTNNQTVIGGSFTTFADGVNTYYVNGLARLNSDGSRDTTFNSGLGVNVTHGEFVRSLALTPANEVVIGGKFTSYNGTQRNGIALVRADGSLDTSFNPGNGFNGTVWSVLVESDGSILAGGDFTSYNGTPCRAVAHLTATGALDTTFNPSNTISGTVYALAQAKSQLLSLNRRSNSTNEDDQVINLGTLTAGTLNVSYNMQISSNDMRVFYGTTNVGAGTGVLLYDSGYVTGTGAASIAFAPVGGLTANQLTIVMNQGGSPANNAAWSYNASVSIPQSSAGIMVGGKFKVTGQLYANIARLQSNGTLDTSFNPGFGPDSTVWSLGWLLNNQVIAGGVFKTVNGNSYNGIVRFNADGSLDNAFYCGSGVDGPLYSILPNLDNTVYVGGQFTTYNGTHRLGFARLNVDGTLDTTFLDTAYNQFAGLARIMFADSPGTVYSAAVQGDGNVMIGGAFQEVGGGQADWRSRAALEIERGLVASTTNEDLWVSEGGTTLEPKARDGVRNRSNVARLIGGGTPGPGNIGFAATTYAVNKTQLSEPISLVRTNGWLGYASANFALTPVLAQSGVDYSYESVPPVYPIDWEFSGPSRMHSDGMYGSSGLMTDVFGELWKWGFAGPASVNINIINSSQSSGNLSAGLTLANPVGADQFYLGGQNIPLGTALGISYAPFTIIDNTHQDGTFGFSTGSYTATNTSAVVSVLRTNSSIGTVTVYYQTVTNGSTAVAGTDYQPTSGALIFSPGQTQNNFAVTVVQNSYISAVEKTVSLQLNNIVDSSGGNAFLGLSNAVLRIINPNYQGYLNLTTNFYTANLSARAIGFTVTRTVGSKGTLRVQYATADGTAVNGTDYAGVTNTLTWVDGDVSPKTVIIALKTNSIVGAPDKQFTVALSNPTLNNTNTPALLGTLTSATMNIVDDNSNGSFQFSQPGYLVSENGGYATITVTRSGSALGAASVQFATTNATAFANTNFVATNGVLNFAAGQLVTNFTVKILNDGQTNPPPSAFYFTVNLFNQSLGAVLGSPVTATVNIVDAQSYNQPAGSLDPSFLGSMNNSVLTLALQPDGRLLAGGDFTLADGTSRSRVARLNLDGTVDTSFLNGLAGADSTVNTLICQTDGRVLIGGAFGSVDGTTCNRVARLMTDGSFDTSFSPGAGANNSVFALAETFIGGARAIYVGGAFSSFNGFPHPGLVRVTDNGAIDSAFATGIGANGTVYALAAYATNSIFNAGQLLAGGAFTNFNGTPVGNLVRLNADGSVDTNFVATVNSAVRAIALQSDGGILIGGDFTNVNSTAVNHLARLNANGTLDLAFLTNSAGGFNGTVSTLALQADNRIVVGGQFSLANGVTRNNLTRLLPTGAVDPTINFGAGANGSVNAVVVQPTDGMIDLGGAFTQFNGQTANYIARVFGNSSTGSGSFQFSAADYSIGENAGFGIITVTRTGGTSGTNADGSGTVYVSFSTTNGGSAVAGVNYQPVSTNLPFAAGEVFGRIFVPVMDDLVITTNLTVSMVLTNPTAPAGLGDLSAATLHIINVDSAVNFFSANYSVAKNVPTGLADIQVVRQGTVSGSCTVNFSTATNGSAVAGTDYYPTNAVLTFNPGETNKTIQVPIINNSIPEGARTIGLLLTNALGSLLYSPSNATLTIIDTVYAPGQLAFSATNYTVNSTDGTATLTVTRTNGYSGAVSVSYSIIAGSAAPGSNYVDSAGQVQLADQQSSATFTIGLINNPLVFQTKTMTVQLASPTAGSSLTAPTNTTVTIVSGNSGVVFQSATNYVSETNTVGLVFVQRLGRTNNTVTVNYATTNNGTAVAGYNYAVTTGTMTFSPGQVLNAVAVPLYNRHITTNISFGLNLSGASAGTTVVSPSSALVYITGSMCGISFTTNAITVVKSATNLLIDVVNSNPGAEPQVFTTNDIPTSVYYYTTNLTATTNDYTPVSGMLVFTNGIATNTISIPILYNAALEGDRSFGLVLVKPTANAVISSPSNEVVTITEINSGLRFSSATYTVLKSNVVKTITVIRDYFTNSTVSVNYATADGTAQAGQQYLPASGTLVFTNGQVSQTFDVTILNNTKVQPDLTVYLQLSNPTNAVLEPYPTFATLTIHDISGSLVVASGAVLLQEGFQPPNGIIDPGETNTVMFGFRASAGVSLTNLYATLLATNGVTFINGATSVSNSYGPLTVGGAAKFQPFTFIANGTNQQNIVPTFNLSNGSSNIGTAVFTFTLGTWQTVVSNTATIIVNPSGAANPYPSYINLSGLAGTVIKSTVTLTNLSHRQSGYMSALVVAPNQSDTLIMSHAGLGVTGGGGVVAPVTVKFDDASTNSLPLNGQIITGTNRPTQYSTNSVIF
jgi:uncharacterized delta-60 repeat protein